MFRFSRIDLEDDGTCLVELGSPGTYRIKGGRIWLEIPPDKAEGTLKGNRLVMDGMAFIKTRGSDTAGRYVNDSLADRWDILLKADGGLEMLTVVTGTYRVSGTRMVVRADDPEEGDFTVRLEGDRIVDVDSGRAWTRVDPD